MLIVTGGSGKLGRLVVDALLELVPAEQIGVSARDPRKLAELEKRGVRVRQGDYDDGDSLSHAWEGATRVLLVSSNIAAYGGDPLKQHETAIGVAKVLGIERLLYTSQISSGKEAHFPPGCDHAATEEMLAASGLAWTALRHGFYADSAVSMNARGFASGLLVSPVDGKVAWATHEDLAEVDARLLAGQETFEGATPPLTGSEALDLADLARLASDATGRAIARRIITEVDLIENLQAAKLPETVQEITLGYYRGARAGEFLPVDPTMERILGRAPQRMMDVLRQALG
ncbi:MAG: NAD(P)H-binding protein [Asticcacaulis sp.]